MARRSSHAPGQPGWLILAQYALRQDLQWRFGLLDSDAINAFSAPGGRVFITRGLYQLPLGDAELAGVLAHEIIHIDQRHAIGIIARGEFWGGVTDLVADNNANYAAFEAAVGDTENLILSEGFGSGKEYEADAGGRELALITGYAPGGLRAVLVTIELAGNSEGSSPPILRPKRVSSACLATRSPDRRQGRLSDACLIGSNWEILDLSHMGAASRVVTSA